MLLTSSKLQPYLLKELLTSSKLQPCLSKQPLKTKKKLKELEIMH